MKKLFFIFILFLIPMFNFGQTHNTNCDCCKYSKNYEKNCKNIPNESKPCGCPACGEQKKKEEAFKKAEDKRINDAIVAKKNAEQAAKKKAEDEAYRKKIEEDRKYAEGTKVSITQSSSNNKSNGKETNNEKKLNNKDGILRAYKSCKTLYALLEPSNNNYFIKGSDTIFKGRFERCYGISYQKGVDENNKFKYPQNVGIAHIKQLKETYFEYNSPQNSNLPICDLIDIKGNRLLNDNNIIHIMHFYSDWFILMKGPVFYYIYQADFFNFSQVEIYNLKTKEKIPVNSYKNQNQIVHILSSILEPNERYDYERPSKFFKVAICTEVGFRENKIYYINENDQIETEIKKY